MRSLLLASAAVFMSVGVAMAQSSPAPTGAPGAPAATMAPNASPGNMAPAPKADDNSMAPSAPASSGNSASSAAPAPTGAPGAPSAVQPGASPGNMAPAASAATPEMSPNAPTPPMKTANSKPMTHTMHHTMAMPADGAPGMYLHIAKMAIMHHDKATADDALSHAETRLLSRAVPADQGSATDESPAVTSIEHARMALSSGNMMAASSDTSMAMSQIHHGAMGGMGRPMSSNASGGDSMSAATANGDNNVQGVPGNGPLGSPTGGPGTFGGPTIMPTNR